MTDLLVRGERVLLPDGLRAATISIADGRITGILPYSHVEPGVLTIDANHRVVMPGLVDTHVHINEPGRTEWEGFVTATRAAAAGGVTTLVDMPLNSIPATTTVVALEAKRRAAAGQCHVDIGFWGGVVPGNAHEIEALAQAGVLGFKCFLSPSGVDEFDHVTETDLRRAMPALAHAGLPLLVHAELPEQLVAVDPGADPTRHATWLATRPPDAEAAAVDLMISFAREFGVHVHIVHVAAADAVAQLSEAQAAGLRVTAETCPHYLTFCADDIPDRRVDFKCAPPIRGRHHREALWQGLDAGVLGLIATDHSPAPADVKRIADGDFLAAWGGIASLQLALPVVWTAARAREFNIEDISRWMSAAPARLAGLDGWKGRIASGYAADLVIWDPDAEFVARADALHHRHKITPYAGTTLTGRVHCTILGGSVVYEDGQFVSGPTGRLLVRGANIPAR